MEDDADIGGTQPRQAVLVEPGIVGVQHLDAALRGAFEPGDDHEQSRFAGAARTHHGDGIAGAHVEVDAAQDGDRAGARGQRHLQIFELDCRVATLFQSVIHGWAEICATASRLSAV